MAFNTSKTSNTAVTTLDPSTQAALDDYRRRAASRPSMFGRGSGQYNPQGFNNALGFASQTGTQGIEQFFDPYQEQVIGGVQGDFDRQRLMSDQGAADLATKEGAFGGSRSAVLQGMGRNDINRNEANVTSGLRSQGFMNALQALLAARGQAGQFGLSGINSAIGEQNAIQQGQGYSLGFGGNTVQQNTTSTPSFLDRLGQFIQLGNQFTPLAQRGGR